MGLHTFILLTCLSANRRGIIAVSSSAHRRARQSVFYPDPTQQVRHCARPQDSRKSACPECAKNVHVTCTLHHFRFSHTPEASAKHCTHLVGKLHRFSVCVYRANFQSRQPLNGIRLPKYCSFLFFVISPSVNKLKGRESKVRGAHRVVFTSEGQLSSDQSIAHVCGGAAVRRCTECCRHQRWRRRVWPQSI